VVRIQAAKQELGFQAQIYNDLEEMPNRIEFPDKTNRGKLLAMLMLWKRVADIAEKKYDGLLKQLVGEGLIKDPKTINTAGTFVLGEAGKLVLETNVSQPRREFNFEWFCDKLQKEYKVPVAVTKAYYDEAKQPGDSRTRRILVKEKGIQI
jgi:hypothetical protein